VPNLVICDTSPHEEKIPNHRFSIKPDCTVYDKGNGAVAGTDSSVAEFFLKFKYSSVDDPFVDSPNPRGSDGRTQEGCTFVKDSRAARKLIGQIGSCVAVQMDVQYRTHTFFSGAHVSPSSSGSPMTFYTPSLLIPTEAPCPDPVQYHTEYPGTPTPSQLAWDPVPTMSTLAYPIPPVPIYRQILLYFHRNHSSYQ